MLLYNRQLHHAKVNTMRKLDFTAYHLNGRPFLPGIPIQRLRDTTLPSPPDTPLGGLKSWRRKGALIFPRLRAEMVGVTAMAVVSAVR